MVTFVHLIANPITIAVIALGDPGSPGGLAEYLALKWPDRRWLTTGFDLARRH